MIETLVAHHSHRLALVALGYRLEQYEKDHVEDITTTDVKDHIVVIGNIEDLAPLEDTRRTSRVPRPSLWHKDYIVPQKINSSYRYPIADYLSYSKMSDAYQSYIEALSIVVEPSTFKKASNSQLWIDAMKLHKVSNRSTKAEYRSKATAVSEIIWMANHSLWREPRTIGLVPGWAPKKGSEDLEPQPGPMDR
ncbi:hypothetical protein MTR67_019042 [Solanum verrucosum]|uniref:Integrase core domain containing protein n=1 Tax=Solanum verrucosum TaxID=315347 RepID=A0AAF0TM36_SOLVR|nr:hypothetical protein MTR67_019042 [Solanum verrucosum]